MRKKYTPQSLTTYKSRLRSALGDFEAYLSNPLAFRPSIQNRERTKPRTPKESTQTNSSPSQEGRAESGRGHSWPLAASNILPVPIRADLTIYIQGLPYDLSEGEARKIAAVITAMAQSQ